MLYALKQARISAPFHYLPLHSGPYYAPQHDGRELPQTQRHADCLIRIPLYYELTLDNAQRVAETVITLCEQFAG